MIKYENECCGCSVPAYPCLGNYCPNRNVPHYYCDRCGKEVDAYFEINEEMICDDCANDIMKEMFNYHILY